MLNDSQKRRVSIVLNILEEDLHDMERLLHSEDYIGIVHEMDNDIPLPVKKALIEKIGWIKDRIHIVAERFNLKREQKSLSRQFYGRLTCDCTALEESKTQYLKGYGSVTEGLNDTLDPELDAVIGLIREMERLLLKLES